MRKTVYIFAFLFFLIGSASAQQYNFYNYTTLDGLPHSQVSSVYQDSKGYLWFTIYGAGVSRFDGKAFTNFGSKEGMEGKLARPVLQDARGNMWFGTLGDGLWKYDGRSFSKFSYPNVRINKMIYSLALDKQQNLWVATDSGAYSYNGDQLLHFTSRNGFTDNPVQGMYTDSEGKVWMGVYQDGLYYFHNGKFTRVKDRSNLLGGSVMSVYEDSEGIIWVGTFNGVVRAEKRAGQLDMQKLSHSALNDVLVYSILDDNKGNIWFATNGNGLVKYNRKTGAFTVISTNNGLPGNIILGLMQDRENNLWLSCWGYGVVRYSGDRFIHYTSGDGLPANNVQSITAGDNDDLILSTGPGVGILKKDGSISQIARWKDESFYWISRDSEGAVWMAGRDKIIKSVGAKETVFTAGDGISAFPANHIAHDDKGNTWFASWSGGLSRWDGKRFINYGAEHGLKSMYIYSVFPGRNGVVWLCTWDEGLGRLEGDKITYYKKEHGLPDNNVIGAAEDSEGNLWMVTYGGGVARFDGKSFSVISTSEGLADDAGNALLIDGNDLWVATNKGLDRIDIDEYNKKGKVALRHYGREEGFSGMETMRNSVYRDDRGYIWFGTKKGITRFDPKEDSRNMHEPITHITAIDLFFERPDWSAFSKGSSSNSDLPADLALPYDKNHLTFHYIGISTTVPSRVQYQYMLEGVDENWSPLTNRTDITYSGLPPGEYTFKVKAGNEQNVWNKEPRAFSFTIRPPFWQTWWFYTSCGMFVLGGFYTFMRVRTRQLERTKRVLAKKVRDRTAEVVKKKNELEVAYREIEARNVLVEQKNRDITDSINYAQRIQKAMLPLEENIKRALPQSFILFKPKDVVSGDFYWFAEKDEKIVIAAADCTGHGVPGAFMSMIGNDQLNHIVIEKGITDPGEILNELNRAIKRALKQTEGEGETRDGMDIALLCFDPVSNIMQYTGANRPVYIIRSSDPSFLAEIKADKTAIGGRTPDHQRFTAHTIELSKGDSVYIASDGYADQFGGETGKKFMTRNFKEMLVRINDKSMKEQGDILEETFSSWKGELEQVDDVLVIGIKM